MSQINSSLLTVGNSIFNSLSQFLPTLFAALVILIIGFILADWSKALVVKLLKTIQLSKITASPAVKKFLTNAQITQTVENIVGESIRILVLLIFIVTALNTLGLSTVTSVLTGILSYIPNVIAAILILVGGILIAGFVEKIVKGTLGGIDIKTARAVGKLSGYIIVIFTLLAAISQLGIAQSFINTLFTGFVAILVLGLGLSIGLGSKDLVKTILQDWYENFKKEIK